MITKYVKYGEQMSINRLISLVLSFVLGVVYVRN